MNWTDERVELLRKLWSEGLSASQIAAQLGGVSRNAVIGKVHRLKLSGRGRSTATPARQKKTAQGSSIQTSPPRSERPRCRRSSMPSRWLATTSARSKTSSCRSPGICSLPTSPSAPANGRMAIRCRKTSTSAATKPLKPAPIASTTQGWRSSRLRSGAGAGN
jgi:hypothetical protein